MKKYIISCIKYLGAVLVLLFCAFLIPSTAKAADFPPNFPFKGGPKQNFACAWGTTAKIKCSDNGGQKPIVPGYEADYYLDIAATAAAGHLVFKSDTNFDAHGALHLVENVISEGNITNSVTDGEGGYFVDPVKNQEKFFSNDNEPDANICAVNNLTLGCINGYDRSLSSTEQNQASIDKATAIVKDVREKQDLLNACNSSNAPLPFIFCPILNGITNAIGGLIGGAGQVEGPREGLLISFLSLPPISSEPGSVLSTVLGNVVDIANILYILIFLVLIFAGSIPFLNLDSYTIKKTLPKFILAVILTQFSLQICSIIVDFFNLLGLAIPNVLFGISQGAQNAALTAEGVGTASKVASGVGATVLTGGLIAGGAAAATSVGWILIIIIAIAALIAAIIAIFYLLIRYFILFTLVIISPIAFVSWVLPGTEKFFKQWWTNFIKLNAMFVTIMAMLSASIVLSAILANIPGASNGALIASVIPIIALLLVPKTLKWTTQGMNAIATQALNAAGKAGGKATKAATGKITSGAKEGLNQKRVDFGGRMAGSQNKVIKGFGAGLVAGKSSKAGVNKAMQEYNKQIDQAKSDEILSLGNKGRDEIRAAAIGAQAALKNRPKDPKAIGAARATIEKMAQTGDSAGLAQVFSEYVSSGRAQGLSDGAIKDGWYGLAGANTGAIKEMSPSLADPSVSLEIADTKIDSTKAGGFAKGESYVKQSGGDFSGLGEEKLAALDADMLKGVVSSINEGHASVGDFKFDKQSVENVLTNPNSRFKSAEARKALQTIAASNGWKYS